MAQDGHAPTPGSYWEYLHHVSDYLKCAQVPKRCATGDALYRAYRADPRKR